MISYIEARRPERGLGFNSFHDDFLLFLMGKLFRFSRHLQKRFGELLPKDTADFVFHYARLDVFF